MKRENLLTAQNTDLAIRDLEMKVKSLEDFIQNSTYPCVFIRSHNISTIDIPCFDPRDVARIQIQDYQSQIAKLLQEMSEF